MSLIFQYKGGMRADILKGVIDKYDDNHSIQFTENEDHHTMEIEVHRKWEEINGKKTRLDPGTDKEDAEWPDPVHP